jgi:hypothetical protein
MKPEEAIQWFKGEMNFRVKDSLNWQRAALAVEALKKQIPKKPFGLSQTYNGRVGNCPNPSCGKLVREKSEKPNICD